MHVVLFFFFFLHALKDISKLLAEAETTGGQLVSVGKALVKSSCVQLSFTAVSYAIRALCEADDKQSALIRRAENGALFRFGGIKNRSLTLYMFRVLLHFF